MRIETILSAGTWDAAQEIDQVLIDFDRRFRRRIVLKTIKGLDILIDLPQAVRLRNGDGLSTGSGIICVRAKPETLMEIHAHNDSALIRIAWHLGNRHLPVQLLGDRIRISADHVIGEMVEKLGGDVETIVAPFDPEAGAYAGGGPHHHHGDDDSDHHA